MLCKSQYGVLHNATYNGVSPTEEHAQHEKPQQRSTDHTKYRQGSLREEFSQIKQHVMTNIIQQGVLYSVVNTMCYTQNTDHAWGSQLPSYSSLLCFSTKALSSVSGTGEKIQASGALGLELKTPGLRL